MKHLSHSPSSTPEPPYPNQEVHMGMCPSQLRKQYSKGNKKLKTKPKYSTFPDKE